MITNNTETWNKGFIVTMATVQSVIQQYAEGTAQLELPGGKGKHHIRYAGPGGTKPYTASTIAKFLGWLEPDGTAMLKTFDAVTALQLVEDGKLDVSAFAGISESQAHKIVAEEKRTVADLASQMMMEHAADFSRGHVRANGHAHKETISLPVQDARKIQQTLISLAQTCLELSKLISA